MADLALDKEMLQDVIRLRSFWTAALGANAVSAGRPYLCGFAGAGAGVRRALALLREEFSLAMQPTGCACIGDIRSDLFSTPGEAVGGSGMGAGLELETYKLVRSVRLQQLRDPMPKESASPLPIGERSIGFAEKRLEILRAVALAFAKDGYHQTSVNSLATQLGVSKPVLYYYAKNKDDLLFQIGQIARDELKKAMEQSSKARLSAIEKLRRFFTTYAEIMCGDFGRCLALIDPQALSPQAREKDVAYRRQLEDEICKLIVEGQEDGTIRTVDPALTMRALFGAFNGIPRWFHESGVLKAQDVVDAYLDLFVIGLSKR